MKRIDLKLFTITTAAAVMLSLSLSAHAQDASSLFKSKCAGCHGADGTGSAMGKKMGAHDFTTADVQGMTDAQLQTSSPTARTRCQVWLFAAGPD